MLLGLVGTQESEREARLTHPVLNLAGCRTNPVSVSRCVAHLHHVTFLRVTVVFSGEAVGRPLVLERTLVWGGFGRGSLGPACSGGDGAAPLLRLGSAASGYHRAALGCNKPGSAGLWLQSHDSSSAPLIHVENAHDIPAPEWCHASGVRASVQVSFSSSPFPLPFIVLPSLWLLGLLPCWDVFLQEPACPSGAGLPAEQEQPGASSALKSWAWLDGEVGTFGNAGGAARVREDKVCKCPAWHPWFPAGLLQCLSEDI